jgi:hypothetical protein
MSEVLGRQQFADRFFRDLPADDRCRPVISFLICFSPKLSKVPRWASTRVRGAPFFSGSRKLSAIWRDLYYLAPRRCRAMRINMDYIVTCHVHYVKDFIAKCTYYTGREYRPITSMISTPPSRKIALRCRSWVTIKLESKKKFGNGKMRLADI